MSVISDALRRSERARARESTVSGERLVHRPPAPTPAARHHAPVPQPPEHRATLRLGPDFRSPPAARRTGWIAAVTTLSLALVVLSAASFSTPATERRSTRAGIHGNTPVAAPRHTAPVQPAAPRKDPPPAPLTTDARSPTGREVSTGREVPAAANKDDTARFAALRGRFRLGGILHAGSDVLAVVNGAVVRAGDAVDGARVIAVDRFGATLRTDGREFRLALVAPDAP